MAVSAAVQARAGARQKCHPASRAMALWPRLDRRALGRCGCDSARIARFISRRTRMSDKAIELLLNQWDAGERGSDS